MNKKTDTSCMQPFFEAQEARALREEQERKQRLDTLHSELISRTDEMLQDISELADGHHVSTETVALAMATVQLHRLNSQND